MITLETIKTLKAYNDSEHEVLSVYLGEDSLRSPSAEFLLSQFHSLLHTYFDKDLRRQYDSDIKRISEFLSDYIPKARSLVFFTAGEQLWQVVELEFTLPSSLAISASPNIKPIVEALPRYSKYLVLLVDREKVRMFTVEQGELVNHSDYVGGYVPQHTKTTGRQPIGGDDAIFRHNETLLKRHIALVARAVVEFTKAQDVHFVIIGGHSEIFKKVAASLPISIRSKIVNSFVTEINIPLNEILLESKKIAAIVNQ
jgi:hypothetical protein